jgi:hypothetical protein
MGAYCCYFRQFATGASEAYLLAASRSDFDCYARELVELVVVKVLLFYERLSLK